MLWLIITVLIVIADQLVKWVIASNAALGEIVLSLPGFDIMYVKNTGAAFSILSDKVPFLAIISIVFCVAAVVYWIKKKPQHPLLCTSLVLLFSGALANALDRIFRGYVVDFISATFVDFPVFNIADIAITIGAVLLVIYVIFFDKSE